MDIIEYGILSINKDMIRIQNNKYREDPQSTTRIAPLSSAYQPVNTDRIMFSPKNTNNDGIVQGEETLISSMPNIAG
jgi:hypothetical protein